MRRELMNETLDFREVYQEYQPKILRYISRLAGPRETEDITQEVFERVSRALDGFRGESTLTTWLYRIATNTALNRMRSYSFDRSAEPLRLETAFGVEDVNVWTGEMRTSPDQGLIRKEMNECIRSFVDRLPPNYKVVIVLSELEGLKNWVIADILQVSLNAAKIRLHRARASLRKSLQANCNLYLNEQNVLSCDLKQAIQSQRGQH
jgi:RNA polymerase sigma-70 factor (ECF subfamily)